jgi:hypothetical protein
MADELGRRVLVMSLSSDGLRGPHQRLAVEAEAKLLSNAIADALDRIALFNRNGQVLLLFNGALHVVNSQRLAWILESYFATAHVVQLGGCLELEYRGCKTNELVLRHMLTAEGKYGGLVEKLPPLVIERPQLAAEEKPQEATSNLPEVQRELEAGARQVARHGDSADRTSFEATRGAEVVARNEGRQVAADPSAREPIAEESYPAYLPDKTNDGIADPARPPQA